MNTTLLTILWALSLLVAGFIGFIAAYLKKKGENLATHEDIEMVVDQVRAVTTATKEIEAKISSDVWDRQKLWELKREVLFETTKRGLAAFDALGKLNVILQTEIQHPEYKGQTSWEQGKIDANAKWFETGAALEESRLLAALTCEKAVVDAIDKYRALMVTVAAKISREDDAKIFKESVRKILELRDAIGDAIRKDLGIK